MTTPEQFYKDQTASLSAREKKYVRKSDIMAICKLLIFTCMIFAVWHTAKSGGKATGIIMAVLSLVLYIAALKTDAALGKRIRRIRSLKKTCENESAYFRNDFSPFGDGAEFTDLHHEYSYDLDIFGPKSLFNRINRTVTLKGKETLAKMLTNLPSDRKTISERQEAIRELAGLPLWRISFIANEHVGMELDRMAEIAGSNAGKTGRIMGLLPYIVSGITFISLAGWISGLASPAIFCTMFMLQLVISACHARKTDRTMQATGSLYNECSRYIGILKDIEEANFKSEILRKLKQDLSDSRTGSSEALGKLSGILNLYDQRGNFLMYLLLNGIVMYDILVSRMFFRWLEKYGPHITGWTGSIAQIDALASLGTYAFNNPDNVYAEILDEASETIIDATDIVHPFLSGNGGVPNSFRLQRGNIAIVTGANMAGKSTFLRTIGVSSVLASNGAPVCARRFAFVPVSLFSSMRTTDNLTQDISYFQAELLRLKQMMEHIKSHSHTLLILDEILKGTNSSDKLQGSVLVLDELSRHETSGIVATHDLGITELEKTHTGKFINYCFEIGLSENIRYSYKIQRGVAQNMNASYLIRIMLGKADIPGQETRPHRTDNF